MHDERVDEEKRGQVRWLRPEYQTPRFAPDYLPGALDQGEAAAEVDVAVAVEKQAWPMTVVKQLEAITALAARGVTTEAALLAAFKGAGKKLVGRHLETLVMLGEV